MTSAPEPELIEKEYLYRYSWNMVTGLVLGSGISIVGVILAYVAKQPVLFWLGIFTSFVISLNAVMVVLVNVRGNVRLIITRDELYLPSLWAPNSYTVVPFSDISEMEVLNLKRGRVLRLEGLGRIPPIGSAALASKDAFDEIVNIVRERVNLQT